MNYLELIDIVILKYCNVNWSKIEKNIKSTTTGNPSTRTVNESEILHEFSN